MKCFSVFAAAIVAISTTIAGPRAEAAQVGFGLVVTAADGGLFAGMSSDRGAVFFDEDLIPTGEDEFISLSKTGVYDTTTDPTAGLFFDVGPLPFPLFTFTEADAISDPVFTFIGGQLRSISYIVTFGSTPQDLVSYGVEQFTFLLRSLTFDGDTYRVEALVKPLIDVPPVPLPAGLPLLAGGLGLLGLLRHRKSRIRA
ncbi:MAG: VPLPA-CTERM sorting domain-containing protein [Paracoccaceae bacterium]